MRSRNSGGGFTVVEILIACSVFIVILVLMGDMFIEALRRTHDGRTRVDLQQRAVFAMTHWERDIEKTSTRAIVVKAGEPYCVALTQVNPDSSISDKGSANWSAKELITWAYQKQERVWQREVYNPTDLRGTPPFSQELHFSAPVLPSYVELDSMVGHISGHEKVMCDNVEDFSFTTNDGGTDFQHNPVQPLLFRLKLRRPLSTSQRFAEFTVERRYTLRNNF